MILAFRNSEFFPNFIFVMTGDKVVVNSLRSLAQFTLMRFTMKKKPPGREWALGGRELIDRNSAGYGAI